MRNDWERDTIPKPDGLGRWGPALYGVCKVFVRSLSR